MVGDSGGPADCVPSGDGGLRDLGPAQRPPAAGAMLHICPEPMLEEEGPSMARAGAGGGVVLAEPRQLFALGGCWLVCVVVRGIRGHFATE